MNARGLALRASLLLATTACCAAPEDEGGDPDETPVEDVPLDLQVDAVDVVHGALRLRATMTGGGPDVSVALGGSCEAREVGGGLSTATALTWTLGETDVADAIDCGLIVRATVRAGRRPASWVASLGLTVALSAAADPDDSTEAPAEEEAPQDVLQESSAQDPPQESTDQSTPDPATETGSPIPTTDLARALLLHRQIVLDGTAFDVSLEVGGVPLS
jgi:hypothetical protein